MCNNLFIMDIYRMAPIYTNLQIIKILFRIKSPIQFYTYHEIISRIFYSFMPCGQEGSYQRLYYTTV